MSELLTPHQVAQAIGVSESSLKRWCDRGLLPTQRTAGGHRRLDRESVVKFLREQGHTLVRPDLLGLPAAIGQGEFVLERGAEQLEGALVAGDAELCRRLIFDLYWNRHSIRVLGDEVISPAFRTIGRRWYCGEIEVYRERRACEVMLRTLHELRGVMPPVAAGAPRALGGTLEGDPYALATMLVELTLRESGWNAESYGALLPVTSLAAAVREQQPRLCWLSISHLEDRASFLAHYQELYETALAVGTALVIGGQAVDESLRNELRYSAYCESLRRLSDFADSLQPRSG